MTMGCVRTFTRRMGGDITPCVAREGGDLRVGCSLICTVNHAARYVRVEPAYLWLEESNHYQDIVTVESNTGWKAG